MRSRIEQPCSRRHFPRKGGWLDVPEAPVMGVDIAPGYLEAGPEFAAPPAPGSLRTPDGSIHAI